MLSEYSSGPIFAPPDDNADDWLWNIGNTWSDDGKMLKPTYDYPVNPEIGEYKTMVEAPRSNLADQNAGLWSSIEAGWDTTIQGTYDAASGAWSTMKQGVSTVWESTTGFVDEIEDKIGGYADGIYVRLIVLLVVVGGALYFILSTGAIKATVSR